MPRDITVTFEDGSSHVYKGAPDDITPSQVETRAAKEFGKTVTHLDGGRGAAPKSSGSLMDLVGQGYLATSRAATDPNYRTVIGTGLTDLPVAVGELTGVASPEYVRQREAKYQKAAQEAGSGAGFGRFMGGTVSTLPLLAIPGAPAEMGLLGRMATGAGIGGGLAALTQPTSGEGNFFAQKGQQAVTGGLFGMAAPLIGAGLGKVAEGYGWLRNRMSPEVNAQNILTAAAGAPEKLTQIRAANAAKPNVLASQAAASIPGTAQAYQTILRRSELEAPDVIHDIRAAQTNAHLATLESLAGGATQTEAETAQRAARSQLTRDTMPVLTEALDTARRPGELIPMLERKVAEGRAGATSAVEDVRRFTAAIDRAEEWAKNWAPSGTTRVPGFLPRVPGQYTHPGELAKKAEEVATGAAEQSLKEGSKARVAENLLSSLKAKGIEPVTPNEIISTIDRRLQNPEIALNSTTAKALARVKQMVQDWTNENGFVDPAAMYAIRKHGINSAIEEIMPNSDAAAKSRAAASVLTEIRPVIDKALGTKFKEYLNLYSEGAKSIDRQALAAHALDLYKKSPSEFRRLIEGDNPDAVEAIFGGGVRNVKEAFGDKFAALQKIAKDVEREEKIASQVSGGVTRANTVMRENLLNARIPNFFSAKVTLINEGIKGLEGKVNAKTLKMLRDAAQSGASMNELLDKVPPSERSRVVAALQNVNQLVKMPYVINALTPANRNSMAGQ